MEEKVQEKQETTTTVATRPKGFLGKKIGMTQVFGEEGELVPVTVIEGGPCPVLQVKTKYRDGYDAIVLGFEDKRFVREIRIKPNEKIEVGQTLGVEGFTSGDYVDITGVTIGKGFQGGMKRWHWKGGRATRGSMHHRKPGSIGSSSDPSRVFKGHHLPGHMGNVVRTTQNLEVVDVDPANSLLLVKGSVPGKLGYVMVKPALKKVHKAKRVIQKSEEKKQAKETKEKKKPAAVKK